MIRPIEKFTNLVGIAVKFCATKVKFARMIALEIGSMSKLSQNTYYCFFSFL